MGAIAVNSCSNRQTKNSETIVKKQIGVAPCIFFLAVYTFFSDTIDRCESVRCYAERQHTNPLSESTSSSGDLKQNTEGVSSCSSLYTKGEGHSKRLSLHPSKTKCQSTNNECQFQQSSKVTILWMMLLLNRESHGNEASDKISEAGMDRVLQLQQRILMDRKLRNFDLHDKHGIDST